jgi:hypothetical protein
MVSMSDRQAVLENAANQYDIRSLDLRKKAADLFGPLENWTMTLGKTRFMLVPGINQWWYYHPTHEQWEFTGYRAGEVVFSEQKGSVSPPPKKIVPVIAARAKFGPAPSSQPALCPSCRQPLTPGKKFCTNCGAEGVPQPAPSSPATCPACGKPLTPGKSFCGSCGRRIP